METCPECGERFERNPSYPTQKFCSRRCKSRGTNRRAHARKKAGAYGACSVEGCDRGVTAKGLCPLHYDRLRRHGDVGPAGRVRKGPRPCKVDACDNRAVTSDDLCPTHRRRKQLYGSPDGSFSTTKSCVVCGEVAVPAWKSSDYCRNHYIEFVKAEVVAGRIEGVPHPSGYVYVSIFKKRYAVHRIVLEAKLGRPLEPFETPHHLNGRRDDNRPENLELWVTPQPSGQRPEDLVAWVVEHYPDLVKQAT